MMRLSPPNEIALASGGCSILVQTRELDSRDCMRICQGKFCYGDKKNLERASPLAGLSLGSCASLESAAPAFYAYTT